jgi:hypothetical protein
MNGDAWAPGPAPSPGHGIPQRPDETAVPPTPSSPSRGAKVAGVLLGVFGGLLVLGAIADLHKPEFAFDTWALYVVITLAIASALGGWNLRTRGWRPGHDLANVLSVLPAAVLVVLIVLGAVRQAQTGSIGGPPADAYGYTAYMRDSFTSGCVRGGGDSTTCTCILHAIEKAYTPAEFTREGLSYERTGQMSSKMTQVVSSSGCI